MKKPLSLLVLLIACIQLMAQVPCQNATGTIVASGYSTTNDGYYQQCVGGDITFSCEGIVLPNGGTVSSIDWYINGDLQASQPSPSLTLSYDDALLVEISADVVSSEGCFLSLQLDMPVAFLSYPEPQLGDASTVCLDENGVLVNVGNISTSVDPITVYPTEGGFLPDGAGFSFEFEFYVSGISQEFITNCNDIESVMLNMEHSYAGDLNIALTCPDGTSVNLVQFGTGLFGTFLGEPVDDNGFDNLEPGIGYDYFWSTSGTATMGETVQSGLSPGNTFPSGYYLPDDSFCNLIGCPINGTWTVTITDNFGADNGYLFYGDISFNAGTSNLLPYDYTESAFNQYTWSSEEFIITDEEMLQANIQSNEGNVGTFSYSYTNPAGCTGTAVNELEFIELPFAVTLTDDFMFDSGDNNVVTAQIDTIGNPTFVMSYNWSPAEAVVNASALSTEVLPITEDTYFTFYANIPDYLGCSFMDSVLVSLPNNGVMLTVFHDANENGIYDEGENPIPYFPIDADILGTVYTSANGNILTTLDAATTFEINVDASNWELTTPSFIEVSEEDWEGYVINYYFGVKPTANINVDVEVALSGITPLCNSNSYAQASIFNNGNYYPGGQVVITLDPLYTFVSSNPAPTSMVGNVITYQVEPLTFNEQYAVTMQLQNPDETSFSEVTNHLIEGYYTISEGVMSEVQDADSLQTTIICSYDPNNKLTHTGTGEENFIDPNTDLEYTINFQNIGNAPAATVTLTDEISDLLDITSLQPIAWSHDFVLSVNGNIATFLFEDIQLLGVEQNEAESHGFVRFKIKQQPNLAPATVIENIAEIVFDNNDAIITNTAINTIITPIGIGELEQHKLNVFPNPTADVVSWNNTDYRLVKVVNALGMTIVNRSNSNQNTYNVSALPAGIYLLQFENSKGEMVRKQLVKR